MKWLILTSAYKKIEKINTVISKFRQKIVMRKIFTLFFFKLCPVSSGMDGEEDIDILRDSPAWTMKVRIITIFIYCQIVCTPFF